MLRKVLLASVVAALAGTGAVAYAQGTLPLQSGQTTDVAEPDSSPTVTEDWCGFMALAFGPAVAAPSVAAAFDSALDANEISPEVAFVALLDGIPPELESAWVSLRAAGQQLTDHELVTEPEAALVAASVVDAHKDSSCAPS